jgi:hypothetical protein
MMILDHHQGLKSLLAPPPCGIAKHAAAKRAVGKAEGWGEGYL